MNAQNEYRGIAFVVEFDGGWFYTFDASAYGWGKVRGYGGMTRDKALTGAHKLIDTILDWKRNGTEGNTA